MLPFAILALALSILVWLVCYGLLMLGVAAGDYIGPRLQGLLIFGTCAALVGWALWFIAHRWPATR